MEVKTKRSSVGTVMAVEVVSQKTSELFSALDVGARVHHVTTRKRFVECWVVTSVQFVHHHLPDWMRPGWAVSGVAVALVGHPEVQGVGPNWDTSQGRGDGTVVNEELVRHHLELLVATDSEVGSSHTLREHWQFIENKIWYLSFWRIEVCTSYAMFEQLISTFKIESQENYTL